MARRSSKWTAAGPGLATAARGWLDKDGWHGGAGATHDKSRLEKFAIGLEFWNSNFYPTSWLVHASFVCACVWMPTAESAVFKRRGA